MSTWPTSLPEPTAATYGEQFADAIIRSQVDVGPEKTRRRFTAVPKDITVAYILTEDEVITLEAFFTDTLLHGAESFDWSHPRTGAAVTARIKSPPTVRAAKNSYFSVSVAMEIMP